MKKSVVVLILFALVLSLTSIVQADDKKSFSPLIDEKLYKQVIGASYPLNKSDDDVRIEFKYKHLIPAVKNISGFGIVIDVMDFSCYITEGDREAELILDFKPTQKTCTATLIYKAYAD
jgi:hypothetical protein